MEAIRREAAEVRVVAPPYELGREHWIEADEWVSLAGCHTPEKVEAAIREAVGRDDWEIIQDENLPLGIGHDPDSLAEYSAMLDEALDEGSDAAHFAAICEAAGSTVSLRAMNERRDAEGEPPLLPGECPYCGDRHDSDGEPDEYGNRYLPGQGYCSNCAETV